MHLSQRAILAALLGLAACSEPGIVTIPATGTPTQLSVAVQPSATAQSGVALGQSPVVRLRDAGGSPSATSGVMITVSGPAGLTFGGSTTATTDGSGSARFTGLALSGLVGNYTLHFASGSLTPVDAQAVALTAGPLARVKITTQPSASATAGIALAQQPAAQLRDAQGNPIAQAGVSVNAVVLGAGASLSNASATTNGSGIATFSGLALGGPAAAYKLVVTAAGASLADTSSLIALGAGTATQVALSTAPATSDSAGLALPTQPVAQLRDAFGNNVAQAGVKVAATLVNPSGGASVRGDTAVTDATGKAAFASLSIAGPTGSYAFRFVASGYASAVPSAATVVTAGRPSVLLISTQPSTTEINATPLAVQPAVVVTDSFGNRVAVQGVQVTATVTAGVVSYTKNTAATDATGKATFSGLAITGQANPYTFQFSAPGFSFATAGQQTLLQPGAPTQLYVVQQPSTTAAQGAQLVQQPQIGLKDVSGNVTIVPGYTITAGVVGGGVTVSNNTAITASNGIAAYSALSLTGPAGSYTFQFTATSLSPVNAAQATNLSP